MGAAGVPSLRFFLLPVHTSPALISPPSGFCVFPKLETWGLGLSLQAKINVWRSAFPMNPSVYTCFVRGICG